MKYYTSQIFQIDIGVETKIQIDRDEEMDQIGILTRDVYYNGIKFHMYAI